MKLPIYLDHHATTPVDPRVLEAMLPYFSEKFGNAASSAHSYGWVAEEAVSGARKAIAEALGAEEREIVFTSGATESNNLALFGVARAYERKGKHVVSCLTEHSSILDPLTELERRGFEVTRLGVDGEGHIDLDELAQALRDDTVLVTLMVANNEIGVLHPLGAIGKICRERGVLFHTDAAQAVGKIPLRLDELPIDLLSLSGHKLYAPKGIGALFVRSKNPRARLTPHVFGGGHERGLRSGTLNVPAIVGLGRAIAISLEEMEAEGERMARLRDRLLDGLRERLDGVHVNGDLEHRLPGNLNLRFDGVDAETLMSAVREIAVSSGSACSSTSLEPSHVLLALGQSRSEAEGAVRFGLGRSTTAEEIDFALERICAAIERLRAVPA